MIKFRQRIFSDDELEYDGGVLAPILTGAGIGLAASGMKGINKANRVLADAEPAAKYAEGVVEGGREAIEKAKKKYLGAGKYFKRGKIRRAEAAINEFEDLATRARSASRHAKLNKLKGKGLLGVGAGVGLYGAYKLREGFKKKKKEE